MAGGRPNMVRADTIDLQDQDSPTAADHQKHIEADSIAPHQAAQFQHVQEERRSEEQTLEDAWNMAGQHGSEQVANGNGNADDEAEKKVDATNTANGEAEDGSDDEDDDDMMDRMSSSPSIEDGAFSQTSPTVATSMSAERHGTPQHAEHERATFNQSPTPTMDSSPFVELPRHMPMRLGVPTSQSMAVQPAVEDMLSPSLYTPETSPLILTAVFGGVYTAPSQHHRLNGRYGSGSGPGSGLGLAAFSDDEGSGEGRPDVDMDAADLMESSDQETMEDQETELTQRRMPGNAFAQQRRDPPTGGNVRPTLALHGEQTQDMQYDHLAIDDQLLNPRLSLISYDDQWESDSSEDWTEQDYQDDDADAFLNLDDRFIDSGWGGECLRDTEDIDFEFVYALHTFVATVEGQANATKGDTMVLLDDSNSYWWLVRVVKDSSIGYLPAEHIETPTERLARLNKHRNIDLSQTMLGDNPEKTRNPLKKAMRRRTAKTVQFAAPTYVEASDYDYSTEDEDGMVDPYGSSMEPQSEQMSDRGAPAEVEERNAPEEANVHATRRFSGESFGGGKASLDSSSKASMDSKRSSIDDPQLSPKLVDRSEAAPLKSRKGTPRNADSFLKDEGMETRKISLTPGLLRDDTVSKASSTESTRTDSFESLVKTPSPQEERSKRDSKDKKKDKKPEKKQGGMLSGLFKSKKKDKKLAARDEGELSDMEKVSAEMSRGSPQSSTSALAGNVSPVDRMVSGPMSAENRAQARSKLQKTAPPDHSRVMSPIEEPVQQTQQNYYQPPGAFVAELEGDNAAYEMATGQEHNLPVQEPEPIMTPPVQEKTSSLSPIAAILRTGSTSGEPKPKKAKRSKQRVMLDDFDEPEEEEQGPNPFLEQEQRSRQDSQESDRLSASPVEIFSPGAGTFMHGTESIHIPQMNVDDSDDDDEEDEDEEVSSKSSDSPSTSTAPRFGEKSAEQPLERPSAQRENTQALMSGMPGYMPPPTPAEESPNPITTNREVVDDSDVTPTVTPQPQAQAQHQPQPTLITATTPKPTDPTPTANRTTDAHSTDSLPSTDDEAVSSTATPETPISSSPQQPSAPQQPEWDDANLRAWFDADDVKDMLAIIHNTKADVDPKAGPAVEHPAMRGLYAAERKGIEGMMGELDGLLGGLLQRKGVVFT